MESGKVLFALGVVSIIGLAYVSVYQDNYTPSATEQTFDRIDAKMDSINAKIDSMDEKLTAAIEKKEQENQQ